MTARRGGVAALLAFALLLPLVQPTVASAGWHSVSSPPRMEELIVADRDTWIARTRAPLCCDLELRITDDGGRTWGPPVDLGAYTASAVAGAEGDSFRVVGSREPAEDLEELQVFRVEVDGTASPLGPTFEATPPETAPGGAIHRPEYALSDGGAIWVPHRNAADTRFELTSIDPGGGASTVSLPNGGDVTAWGARKTALGMRLLRFGPQAPFTHVQFRGTYRLNGGGDPVPAEAYPVAYVDGDLLFADPARASWDGGDHWSYFDARVIERSPGLGMPRYLGLAGEPLLKRTSSFLFSRTGLELPDGVFYTGIVDAGRALVVWNADSVHVHEGSIPSPPLEIGALQPDTRMMLARANQMRADAGLPPLAGDALISQASRNHSRYSLLHPDEMQGLSAHNETTGMAGFTGHASWTRCTAVGTECGGEVMFSPGELDPVGGWLATVYHRPLPGSPEAGVVGAARVEGGWSVMNGHTPRHKLVRPFGYPNGIWRGDEGFAGEVPDPVQACQQQGQSIEYPIGIAVSLYLPGGSDSGAEVTRIRVRPRGAGADMPGCLLTHYDFHDGGSVASLVLDDPLVPGQAYDVEGDWATGSDWVPGPTRETGGGTEVSGTTLRHRWSFLFQPDGYAEGRSPVVRHCPIVKLKRLKSTARPRKRGGRRRGKGIEAKLRLNRPAVARLRRASLAYRTGGKRRVVRLRLGKRARRNRRVGRKSQIGFRLPRRPASSLAPGRKVRLKLVIQARARGGCGGARVIRANRRARVGWVRTRARASWRTKPKRPRKRGNPRV